MVSGSYNVIIPGESRYYINNFFNGLKPKFYEKNLNSELNTFSERVPAHPEKDKHPAGGNAVKCLCCCIFTADCHRYGD